MKNSNHIPTIKERDTKHRRMTETVSTSLQDMRCAEFIRIDNDTRELTVRQINEWGEFGLYGEGELIGYIRPSVKKQVVIEVRKAGILFQAFIKYTKIKCYAKP